MTEKFAAGEQTTSKFTEASMDDGMPTNDKMMTNDENEPSASVDSRPVRGTNKFKDLWALIIFGIIMIAYFGLSGYALYELEDDFKAETSFSGGKMSNVHISKRGSSDAVLNV